MDSKAFLILYQFWFNKEDHTEFKVLIDPVKLSIIQAEKEHRLDWTKLAHHQCECCPLTPTRQSYCMVAVNIAAVIDAFKDRISYDRCFVRCNTPERTYQKTTSLMEGLSSLLGLVMATSGCPKMALFRPMARFHLPFATMEETLVRVTSMYLLGQYFTYKNQKQPDFDLVKLNEHYKAIKLLNAGLLNRIKGIHRNDSDKNAILIYHSLSDFLSMEINGKLSSIAYLFV